MKIQLPSVVAFTPIGSFAVFAIRLRSIDWAMALRTLASSSGACRPLNVTCEYVTPPEFSDLAPDFFSAAVYVSTSCASTALISLFAKACACEPWSMTVQVILSRSGFSPHHFGFGVSVYALALLTILLMMYGPL